jgi:hypothetical protein
MSQTSKAFSIAITGLVCGVYLSAMALAADKRHQKPDMPKPLVCSALAGTPQFLPNPRTVITSATLAAATPDLPEHCEIFGTINERVSPVDGLTYAIKFHLRLPTPWNGRFYFAGGGGFNGAIGDALGTLPNAMPGNALARGYAVVSQDAGHDASNSILNWNGPGHFAFDPEARIDMGYRSYDEVARAAKALISRYYGKGPQHSYFVGCSEGGREGLMFSQRFPKYFDGILAGAPVLDCPRCSYKDNYIAQTLAVVAEAAGLYDADGLPFINKTFTDSDLLLMKDHLLATCDVLDGVKDGMTANFLACDRKLDFSELQCAGAKQPACLSAEQLAAIQRLSSNAESHNGRSLFRAWFWDHGFIEGAARPWWLGPYDATRNSGQSVTFSGGLATSTLFTTPPTQIDLLAPGALARYALSFDLDRDSETGFVTSGIYTVPSYNFMFASSANLDEFRLAGGKMLVYTGQSDGALHLRTPVEWVVRVEQRSWREHSRSAKDFLRLFAVPGMGHCSGGPAADQFPAFDALVAWVEGGKPPHRIIATARADNPANPWPGRTRPLCPYPEYARYSGQGSIEHASSFHCVRPH